jgi:hypothetical protein
MNAVAETGATQRVHASSVRATRRTSLLQAHVPASAALKSSRLKDFFSTFFNAVTMPVHTRGQPVELP